MSSQYIQFKDFSFKYEAQAQPTLKEVTFSIAKGAKVLIIGPSGSGKSTIGQCLNGIIPNIHKGEQSGLLTINGQEAFDLSIYDKSQLVSTVLQDPDGQFIGLTVAEDLAFALENDCVEQERMTAKVKKWSQTLDLTQFLDHRPQDLSGGQKQRVSLAGVLVDESPILLFDEPLANLDPKSGQDTIALIDQLHQENQATTIIIEHRLEDVLFKEVDQVILVNDGQILFDGTPDQLLASNLLTENGIREPLYLTVLKALGYSLKESQPLSRLQDLDFSDLDLASLPQFQEKQYGKELLSVSDLTYGYREDQPILKGVTLTLHEGERVSIVGKNGAGKSTLAKALCQFLPLSPQMTFKGNQVGSDSIKERAERIGYVLQNPNQMISQAMIFDEVALGLRLRGVSEEEIKDRVEETLRICGLHAFRNWPISALSFGQKKRVTIASILVLNPEIILLDEPTAGQDQRHYTEIMSFLDQLQARGHTIVMITHDMQLMMEYSDRTLVVSDGRIIADDHPIAILSQDDLLEKANLKKTSLFQLAEQLDVNPFDLTAYYIAEKGVIHGH